MTQVKTINFKGKPYVEVAERVRLVHEMDVPFEVLESEPLTISDRVVWRVKINVNGKIYTGCAEAKIHNAAPKSADATNPFECAETSALGRALSFAGLGNVDGIASYDEIARGLPSEQNERSTPQPSTTDNKATTPTQLMLKKEFEDFGVKATDGTPVTWTMFVAKALGYKNTAQAATLLASRDLEYGECEKVFSLLQQYRNNVKQSQANVA